TRRISLLTFYFSIFVGLLAWECSMVRADEPETIEQRVKAAFLYRFASYVDWPTSAFSRPGVPFTIAVVGAEAVASELGKMVNGRTLNDRPVVVKRLKAGDPLTDVHILFIGATEAARVQSLAVNAQSRSILSVTESDGALTQGSVINFVVSERKVRFEISLDSAEKSKLKLSSRLLAVAQDVRMEGK
ncbi:MAG TPA: YfiR family protein, partial [Pyrinomonadaceae bacterium]|nr:YfiR family protein [Pyrinomonadaceae bacterium]